MAFQDLLIFGCCLKLFQWTIASFQREFYKNIKIERFIMKSRGQVKGLDIGSPPKMSREWELQLLYHLYFTLVRRCNPETGLKFTYFTTQWNTRICFSSLLELWRICRVWERWCSPLQRPVYTKKASYLILTDDLRGKT